MEIVIGKISRIVARLAAWKQLIIWGILVCLSTTIFSGNSQALNIQQVPNPRQVNNGWVSDMANILSNSTENQLNQMIRGLEFKNGTEIAIVTVPETAPAASPKQFTTQLFNYWGIGKEGQNNGVLLLTSVGDRRVEIETGKGVARVLPNTEVGNIIKTKIIPHFKQEKFEEGILAGTQALIGVLNEATYSLEPSKTISNFIYTTIIAISSVLFSLFTYRVGNANNPRSNQELITPSGYSREEVKANNIGCINLLSTLLACYSIGYSISLIVTVYIWQNFGRSAYLSLFLAFGFGVILTIIIFIIKENKTFIISKKKLYCADCQQRMERVDDNNVNSLLTQPQQIAKQIGSVKYQGYQCPNCSPNLSPPLHIRAWILNSSRFKKCRNCQELTITTSSKTIQRATTSRTGIKLITHKCGCCHYYREKREIIPRVTSSSSSSDNDSSSSSSGEYNSGSNFGGGESEEDGGGSDW